MKGVTVVFLVLFVVLPVKSHAQDKLYVPTVKAWFDDDEGYYPNQDPIGYSEKAACDLAAEREADLGGYQPFYLVDYPPSDPKPYHGCTYSDNITPEGYCDNCGTLSTHAIYQGDVCPEGFMKRIDHPSDTWYCDSSYSGDDPIGVNLGGCNGPGSPMCGNPINFGIGNKYVRQDDYVSANGHLEFSRFYNSKSYSDYVG